MFRHYGKTRTLSHNLKIASLLSFVAGMVNVIGFFSVKKLTTNVTGHFAFFVDEVLALKFQEGFVYFLYIFFFFLGSFISNFITEVIYKKNERFIYIVPTTVEAIILFSIALFGHDWIAKYPNIIACSLLFAMGLQNSLVTKISNAAVRTTHLTGLFTDLGIELSQLFFYKTDDQKQQLLSSIRLRVTIISFFFLGGIIGGLGYLKFGLATLSFAALALISGLIYDYVKFKFIQLRRKFTN